jgi:hypothetical protein
LNLGAGVPFRVSCWQGGDRLQSRQRSRRRVEAIAGDTAALLVGKVEDVLSGMKAKVARPQVFRRLDLERGVGGQMTGVFVEPELENGVGAVPRDVGHEGKFVGRVGLHGVGARGRF